MATNQLSNLRPCPFCGKEPAIDNNFAICVNDDCELSDYWSGLEVGSWNTRPIEDDLRNRIAELEGKQRWIPVSEPPKECEMRVFKDGNAWCFVLPDFQDLQVSPSVWMKKGVLDKIYKELRSVRDE